MNCISYCLFTPLNKDEKFHREWDDFRTQNNRYWFNIPALFVVNSILYPDFKIKLFISKSISSHPLFPLLKELDKQDNFETIIIEKGYKNTEPTMWRMIPLWDKTTSILLCRDIDSIPTEMEVNVTRQFIDSTFLIHTIRSHRQHNNSLTRMLAGLSGFKKDCLRLIKIKSFEEYYQSSSEKWGCDQDTLIKYFYSKVRKKRKYFLDSALSTNIHKVKKNWRTGSLNYVKVDENQKIYDVIDSHTKWSGQPIDFRKNKLIELLQLGYPQCELISSILNSNNILRSFYLKD